MSYKIDELRALPDTELVRLHDELTPNVYWAVNDYLQELDRRDRARGERAALALAKASNRVATIAVAVSVASFVVAVLAIFLTR